MKSLTLALLIISFASAAAQNSAPSIETCSATISLWGSEIHVAGKQFGQQLKDLSSIDLRARSLYVMTCTLTYPSFMLQEDANKVGIAYIIMAYETEIDSRHLHFLARHHLLAAFREEEKEGKR